MNEQETLEEKAKKLIRLLREKQTFSGDGYLLKNGEDVKVVIDLIKEPVPLTVPDDRRKFMVAGYNRCKLHVNELLNNPAIDTRGKLKEGIEKLELK